MKKRIIVIIICAVLVFAILAGVAIAIIPHNTKPSDNNEQTDIVESSERTDSSDSNTSTETDPSPAETESFHQAPVPIPDLEDGNEIYLDMEVLEKLQEIEDAGDEDKVNEIFDTMFLLINEFVDQGYSALAISQIQRFYFTCFDDLREMDFNILCEKIAKCFPVGGAVEANFSNVVTEHFGVTKASDFRFVFDAEVAS